MSLILEFGCMTMICLNLLATFYDAAEGANEQAGKTDAIVHTTNANETKRADQIVFDHAKNVNTLEQFSSRVEDSSANERLSQSINSENKTPTSVQNRRRRQALVTDRGYISRLKSGLNIAKGLLVLDFDGIYGLTDIGKQNSDKRNIASTYDDIFADSFEEGYQRDSGEHEDDEEYVDLPEHVKRSLSDIGYGSRIHAANGMANTLNTERLFGIAGPGKRAITDIGYGSRIAAAGNIANALNKDKVFGIFGPGKRAVSDIGYGSRIDAAYNMADILNRERLFGIEGPGKRTLSDIGYGSRIEAAHNIANALNKDRVFGMFGPGKRAISDIGYGSRIDAANNLANTHNTERLFGIEGPGKRTLSDIGYGSRIEAAHNVANALNKDRVFGIFGPGKRAISDIGYGSRIDAANNVAEMLNRERLFGLEGPGKRSLSTLSDVGYGSRIEAASNMVNDWNKGALFGIFGPGKRNNVYETGISELNSNPLSYKFSGDYDYDDSKIETLNNVAHDIDSEDMYGLNRRYRRKRSDIRADKQNGKFSLEKRDKNKGLQVDTGYGSRILAGARLSKTQSVRDELFGQRGPGRR